ncbi:MAG: P1 family peptidase [Aquisalinus sp.]|nr:P1 family peptidase [Aquisalinus sp.]
MTATKAGPGPLNDITDVEGILVGQAEDDDASTGVTVILPDPPCVCGADIRGGGPGTRETGTLLPETLVDRIDALVLAGGSVYGLGAADGVTAAMGAEGRGFSLIPKEGVPVSPIVPAAILYDLANGGDKSWADKPPYPALGAEAYRKAGGSVAQGKHGAGFGARAGAYPGGIGSASYVTEDGWQIGAIAAVNSFGSPYMPDSDCFWAWPYELDGEFGGRQPQKGVQPAEGFPPDTKIGMPTARANTTIAAVAVNLKLSKPQAKRLAIMAQDGLARAIRPVHAPADGDVVFALGTGRLDLPEPAPLSMTRLGTIAADCLARAVARGVFAAEEQTKSA